MSASGRAMTDVDAEHACAAEAGTDERGPIAAPRTEHRRAGAPHRSSRSRCWRSPSSPGRPTSPSTRCRTTSCRARSASPRRSSTDWPIALARRCWSRCSITFLALALALVGGVALADHPRPVATGSSSRSFPIAVILQVTPIVAIAPLHPDLHRRHQQALLDLRLPRRLLPDPLQHDAGLKSDRPQPAQPVRALRREPLADADLSASSRTPCPISWPACRIAGGLALIAAVVAEFAAGSAGARLRPRLPAARIAVPAQLSRACSRRWSCSSLTGVAIFAATSLISWLLLRTLARERREAGELTWRPASPRSRRTALRPRQRHACPARCSTACRRAATRGLGAADIVIADGRSQRIAPGRAPSPATARLDLDGGMVWPAFVDMHTHLDKGHIWPRQPNPDGTLHRRARRGRRRPRRRNWSAEDVERRMDFALRCAYAHGTAAIRTHLDSIAAAARASPGRCSPRCASAGPAASSCRRCRSSRSTTLLDDGLRSTTSSRRSPSHGGVLGAVTYRGARARARRSSTVDARRGEPRPRPRLPRRRDRRPGRALAAHHRRAALATGFPGRIVAGHCCSLAMQPTTRGASATIDARRRGRHRRRLAADVQHVPAGPRRAGRTPRWRGVTLLHELAAARRAGRRRLRQHPRPVLRLWRPRHARGVPRGGRASSISTTRIAGLGRRAVARDAGRDRRPRPITASSRAGAPPISSSSAPAPGPSSSPVRSPTASCSAPARRSTRTLPDYRELDDLMEALTHDRHRRVRKPRSAASRSRTTRRS